jgi:hypothetical protein
MEVILLATEARRTILAGKTVSAASFAASMETIRWDKRPALVKSFFGQRLAPPMPTAHAISDLT